MSGSCDIIKQKNASLSAENHSLKRIKSESFAANVTSQQQSRSPYDPSSVPAPPSGSWIQSPSGALPSVLSPYGPSTSTSPQLAQTASQQQHQQRCGPPSAPSKYGGPGTPATPSNAQNPPSIGPAIGTSPGSTGNALQTSVQQQGSVEAVSVSGETFDGSAPYTPASVGSLSGSAHLNNVSSSVTSTGTCENSATTATPQTTGSAATTNNCLNELSSSLNIGQIDDFFDDLIFSDAKMSSAAEMQKYLNEDFLAGSGLAEINAALKCESDVSRTITDAQDWNDVAQVIAEQS
ncbi:unnamed protein product [Anisakis simplex]|uniref:LD16921p (inferred by orthology to a D. melanogaster protein) n=1 Tax=Anisakis simplex TaxID=6269 RepID=A0A0M3K6A2_ANISI|nr:unnamed protein product [Anisakis simplex]